MASDGCSLDPYITRLRKTAGDSSQMTAIAIGIDPDGEYRVIRGAWPARLFASFAANEDLQAEAAIARVSSLADRFGLRADR